MDADDSVSSRAQRGICTPDVIPSVARDLHLPSLPPICRQIVPPWIDRCDQRNTLCPRPGLYLLLGADRVAGIAEKGEVDKSVNPILRCEGAPSSSVLLEADRKIVGHPGIQGSRSAGEYVDVVLPHDRRLRRIGSDLGIKRLRGTTWKCRSLAALGMTPEVQIPRCARDDAGSADPSLRSG